MGESRREGARILSLRGLVTMSGSTLGCHDRGGGRRGPPPGIQWVQAKDAAEHTTLHRTAPTAKDYPIRNVNSAKTDTPQ